MLINKIVEEDGKFFVYSHDGKKKLSKGYATEKEAAKRLAEIEYFKNNIQSVTFNVSPNVRHDTMEGREYLVAPMVMLTEGVHAGSNGPLYYPAEELGRTPEVWNHKPVVVYHPTMNGKGVSACDPVILTSRKVGVIMNTKFEEGKLKAEAWLEKSRIDLVDNRISEFLNKKKMMELSTGLFTDNEDTEGEWKGEKYSHIARNYRPDHLALLPDQKGACSIADGAGLLRNNEQPVALGSNMNGSFRDTEDKLWKWLNEQKILGSINDVFDSFFIYDTGGKKYKRDYAIKEGKLVVSGLPVEVQLVRQYKTPDGKIVANDGPSDKEKQNMDKAKFVDGLIKNDATQWEESDREFLMGLDEAKLAKLAPTGNEEDNAEDKTEEKVEEKVEKTEVKTTENKEVTVEAYIANAPAGIRDMLMSGIKSHEDEKAKCIKVITANKANTFSEAFLKTKGLAELKGLAQLAAVQPSTENTPIPMFQGMCEVTGNATAEEPLDLPVMNFGK